jgi:hypothetical protein
MKYVLLIFFALVGNSSFAQQVTVYPQPVVNYPVVILQPVVEQQTRWIPVVEQRVQYVPMQIVPLQPQGYWIRDCGWLLCKERWRYVPYNY